MQSYKFVLFSLIELLVVITIIGILTSILLPVLKKARDKANTSVCKSNMKQSGVASMLYADAYNGYTLITNLQQALPIYIEPQVDYWYNVKIFHCPICNSTDIADLTSGNYSTFLSYIMNSQYMGKKLTYLPTKMVWLCDREEGVSVEQFWTTSHLPFQTDGRISARHNKSTNCLYVDGHTGTMKFTEMTINKLNGSE